MSTIPIASIYFSNIFNSSIDSHGNSPHTSDSKQNIADYIFNDIFFFSGDDDWILGKYSIPLNPRNDSFDYIKKNQ